MTEASTRARPLPQSKRICRVQITQHRVIRRHNIKPGIWLPTPNIKTAAKAADANGVFTRLSLLLSQRFVLIIRPRAKSLTTLEAQVRSVPPGCSDHPPNFRCSVHLQAAR